MQLRLIDRVFQPVDQAFKIFRTVGISCQPDHRMQPVLISVDVKRPVKQGQNVLLEFFHFFRRAVVDQQREFIAGKPVYQGIWMDQILEKLPSEEIVAAPYYNGDAVTMIDENPDLAFYVPKEGTNLFVDAMCIPKNAKNVSGAEKFINFMCSTEAAMANWEYIGYSSPQTEVYNELDEEITSDPLYFPDITQYPTEAYTNLPTEINQFYNDLWVDILT